MIREEDYYIDDHNLEEVRNSNEILVVKVMRRLRDEFPDFDGCQICIEDVYAASLNQLTPMYKQNTLVLDPGDLLPEDQVEPVVRMAYKRVIENPRHK